MDTIELGEGREADEELLSIAVGTCGVTTL
jgi:hypothetical protein